MFGARISVGRCTCSIVQAIVADLPDPVMPSSVWKRSPRRSPSLSAAMAVGWSPAAPKSDTTWNGWLSTGAMTDSVRNVVRSIGPAVGAVLTSVTRSESTPLEQPFS